jgi:hypothetical protein
MPLNGKKARLSQSRIPRQRWIYVSIAPREGTQLLLRRELAETWILSGFPPFRRWRHQRIARFSCAKCLTPESEPWRRWCRSISVPLPRLRGQLPVAPPRGRSRELEMPARRSQTRSGWRQRQFSRPLPNASQLCEMGLHGFHLDAMLGVCCIRKVRETPTTRRVPASRRKWQSRAWPSRQE